MKELKIDGHGWEDTLFPKKFIVQTEIMMDHINSKPIAWVYFHNQNETAPAWVLFRFGKYYQIRCHAIILSCEPCWHYHS